MSRLPVIAGDNSTWGTVLNDYLSVSHQADGTLTSAPVRAGGTTSKAVPIPYYNVKDFGALGDGVTDDTAAINAAFAAAVATPGWVVFPAGTFVTATATGRALGPATTINGLHIIGAGIGNTIIKSTATGAAQVLGNAGNDHGWIIEGLELQGPVFTSRGEVGLNAANGVVDGFGIGCMGLSLYFLRDSVIRACKISQFNAGIYETSGSNFYDCWCISNHNAGIILNASVGGELYGTYQVSNAQGNIPNGKLCANIVLANSAPSAGGPTSVRINCAFIDELGTNDVAGGSSLYIAAGTDISVNVGQVYAPGKQQGGNAPYYGIRIGGDCHRVQIRGTRVMPYSVDATRVPNNTIIIESGATDTLLSDVSTNPNLANGGGDILDSGTRTVYRNVSLNDGPRFSSVATKAGVPVDGDYQVAPPVGTQVLDTTDGKIYYRTASATWKAATLT